jgi:hypothetical protein
LPTTYTFFHQDRPLFILDPHSFALLANKNRLTGTTAQDVLGSILRLMQLRRTKATEMDIRGKTVCIRAEIPVYEIATVELKMSRAQEVAYKAIYYSYVQELLTKTQSEDQDEDRNTNDDEANDERQSDSGEQPADVTINKPGFRNQGFHRRLCLTTLDPRLETFCNRAVNKHLSANIKEYIHIGTDDGLSIY